MKFTSIILAAAIAITAIGTLAPAASARDRGVAAEEVPRVLMVRDHRGDRNYRRHHEGRRHDRADRRHYRYDRRDDRRHRYERRDRRHDRRPPWHHRDRRHDRGNGEFRYR